MKKTKEEIALARKIYYLNNKEHIKTKAKAWNTLNKEKKKIYDREYLKTHRKEINLRISLWQKKNHEKYRKACRERENNPMYFLSARRIYKSLKYNSKKRGMDFPLLLDDFVGWYKNKEKKCFYCGVDEETIFKSGLNRFDIERIDNNLSYQLSNIELACRLCNKTKSNLLTADEMKFIGKEIIIKKWNQKTPFQF